MYLDLLASRNASDHSCGILSSWLETAADEEHLCKLRLRPFSWLVHEPLRDPVSPMSYATAEREGRRSADLFVSTTRRVLHVLPLARFNSKVISGKVVAKQK